MVTIYYKLKLGGGFKYFLFSSLFGEGFPFWLIFFRWVGSTTNQESWWTFTLPTTTTRWWQLKHFWCSTDYFSKELVQPPTRQAQKVVIQNDCLFTCSYLREIIYLTNVFFNENGLNSPTKMTWGKGQQKPLPGRMASSNLRSNKPKHTGIHENESWWWLPTKARWWFQMYFCSPPLGEMIQFFKWVETTNQKVIPRLAVFGPPESAWLTMCFCCRWTKFFGLGVKETNQSKPANYILGKYWFEVQQDVMMKQVMIRSISKQSFMLLVE